MIGQPRTPRDETTKIAAPLPRASAPPPEVWPDTVPPGTTVQAAPDPSFKPPILRSAPALIEPPGVGRIAIDLELRVDPDGRVRDVREVDAAADSAAFGAARRCALGMRFYPALRADQPVMAWSRRRFEFGGR